MSKGHWIGLMLVMLMAGCVERIDLRPFTLPDLVQSFVRKVECFDEHQSALIATDAGVLLKYETEQVIYNASRFEVLNEIQWDNARILYAAETQVFWTIEGEYILELGPQTLVVHRDTTEFFQPTKFYFDYALSQEGKLYRAGYYKEVWDGGFESDYFIALYEFLGFSSGMWEEYRTDMTIQSTNLNNPYFLFTEDNAIQFATNPQYRVTSLEKEEVAFESIVKQGEGFNFEVMASPELTPGGMLYGFDRSPTSFEPLRFLYTSDLTQNAVTRINLEASCTFPDGTQGLVKVLQWRGDRVQFYLQRFTNANSDDKSILGYIVEQDATGADECTITPLLANDELRTSDGISDLDVLGTNVFLGTRNGLLIYDLETDVIESYTRLLFDEQDL